MAMQPFWLRSTGPAKSASASFPPERISAAPPAGWRPCSPPSRPRSPADLPARWRWREPISTIPRRSDESSPGGLSRSDPVVDEAFGESAHLRYYSPVLQTAVDGLFAALAGWRAVAVHL